MRCVRGEAAKTLKRFFQPFEKIVEHACEVSEFILDSPCRQALMEAIRRYLLSADSHLFERRESSPGKEITPNARDCQDNRHRKQPRNEQFVRAGPQRL